MNMTATLTLKNSKQAEEFAIAWGRLTSEGHGIDGNKVTVYNIDVERKEWINKYINKLNKS